MNFTFFQSGEIPTNLPHCSRETFSTFFPLIAPLNFSQSLPKVKDKSRFKAVFGCEANVKIDACSKQGNDRKTHLDQSQSATKTQWRNALMQN